MATVYFWTLLFNLQNYRKVEASDGWLNSGGHELVAEAVINGPSKRFFDNVVNGGHEMDDPILDVLVGELPNFLVTQRARLLLKKIQSNGFSQ